MGMYPGKYGEALDRREITILELYGEGLYRRDIAEELNLAVTTIKKYEARIRRKLGARHTIQAMAFAYHKHILIAPVKEEVLLFNVNRAQALGFFNLSQRMMIKEEITITDQDNYDALIVNVGRDRYKLPIGGGVVDLEPTPSDTTDA